MKNILISFSGGRTSALMTKILINSPKYKDCNILLLVWPPYDKPMANNALKKFKGNKLVYIGEEEGGATANDNFYIRLKKNWKQVDKYDIPGWIYSHDTMTFYERK